LSFAYGSGVFKQDGQKSVKDNMTDLILVVEDHGSWHKHNLLFNPDDYSGNPFHINFVANFVLNFL